MRVTEKIKAIEIKREIRRELDDINVRYWSRGEYCKARNEYSRLKRKYPDSENVNLAIWQVDRIIDRRIESLSTFQSILYRLNCSLGID